MRTKGHEPDIRARRVPAAAALGAGLALAAHLSGGGSRPTAGALANVAATAAAAVLLLGGARLADDLREVADRVLPRRWWQRPAGAGRIAEAVPGPRREERRSTRPAWRPAPRGPPLAA